MTRDRWFLVFGLCWALVLAVSPAGAATQTVATGQVIELGEDANGFALWPTVGGGGVVGSLDDVALGGTIGQLAIGAPDPLAELCKASGFWAPAVCYDTTDVDPSDSTDVVGVTLFLAGKPAAGIDGAADAPVLAFSLAPVFPNPSHGVAYIGWAAPRESNVRLSVHDVQGREVAVLVDGVYAAGRHGVRWGASSAKDVSTGVYFVRLETPDGVFTRRVAMIQ